MLTFSLCSYELSQKQSSGPGAVLSFETGSTLVSQQVVEACKIFGISVSFGCVNSLIRYTVSIQTECLTPSMNMNRIIDK